MQLSNLPLHTVHFLFLFTIWITTTTQASPICPHNRTSPSTGPSSLSQNATQSRRHGRIRINYLVPGTSTLLILTQEFHGRLMPVQPTIALLSSAGPQLEAEAANAGGRSLPLTQGFVHISNELVVDAWELWPPATQERLRYENVFAVLVGLRATMNQLEWIESDFEIHVTTAVGSVRVGTGTIGVDRVESCFGAGAVSISGAELTA